MRRRACSTALRRCAGREADELTLLCRPTGEAAEPGLQAEAVYRTIAECLAGEGASFAHVASETLYSRDVRRELPLVLEARSRLLAALGGGPGAPSPEFVEQAPLCASASFEVALTAVVPRAGAVWSKRDVAAAPECACAGCARSAARLIELGERVSVHTSNVYGVRGGDAFAEASAMFAAAERLLERCGLTFRDVVRTWIYLRDIDRDYEALNRARRQFFQSRGIEPRPASTGVQGGPFPAQHDFSMTLSALRSSQPLDITVVSTPFLSEAWEYGADFSRALRVGEADRATLHISGTASIDEAGRSIHAGDFTAQVDRMLDNIASLLERQGGGFADVVSAVTYLKHAGDAPLLRAKLEERGFTGFPCALVEAPLCRPELLCEAEAVAVLPSRPAAA